MRNTRSILTMLLGIIVLAALVGCASTSKREGTGEYFDDSVITSKVKAAIAIEPVTKTLQISVETYKGIVQLSGFVDTEDMKQRAESVAARVSGVKSVKNNLVIR